MRSAQVENGGLALLEPAAQTLSSMTLIILAGYLPDADLLEFVQPGIEVGRTATIRRRRAVSEQWDGLADDQRRYGNAVDVEN